MNPFSVLEAIDLAGFLNLIALGIAAGIVGILMSIIVAHISWDGWTGFNTFLLVLDIFCLVIVPLYFGWLSCTVINTEYNEIMAVDTTHEYTALQVYKEFGVEKPDGVYQVDLSEMDKELFSQIKRDEKNPYDFILKKVPNVTDKEAIGE